MSAAAPQAPVRILHLSDIHFRAGKAWDADPVLHALAGFIAGEVKAGLLPDLVVITGDLAFAGKAAEYDLARTWLADQLWPALAPDPAQPLPRDRLLLVPGNHDVDRDAVGRMARTTQDALLAEPSADALQHAIAALFGDADERGLMLKRHAAWVAFHAAWLAGTGTPAPTLPWWQRTLDLRGLRLHIAGLDSAWMACGNTDRGRLLLGRYQVHDTVLHRDADGADWRLALLHHPWDYLAELDAAEARGTLHLHRDLLLRGHLHETEAHRVVPTDPRRACLELAAGCVYETSRFPNVFQWVELYPPADGRPRRVRVHFRAWINGAWGIDRNQPGCPEGAHDFDLDAARPHHQAQTRPTPAADPRKYLGDLCDDTAHIDIRGLVTGRPDAHRFPISALYIELQATAGGALKGALTNRHLVIIGDPGCGKTTFLRWVAHCLAADRLGRDPGGADRHLGLKPGPHGVRMPISLSIADWLAYLDTAQARQHGPPLALGAQWLPAYLGARAEDANQGLDGGDFRRWLAAGEALLLLDGLDEAPDRRRRKDAVTLIEQVARAWPDCPIAVTSRPAAYQDDIVISGFDHIHIEALDAAAIDGFLARWSQALFPDRPVRAKNHHRALAAALASCREIRQLARNTVMLTALAVVHWNDKRLPEQRADLYESIVKWLIESREQRPGREKSQRCRQILADLALAMQATPGGRQVQVTRRWAAERIAGRFGAEDAPEAVERAEAFLAEEEIDSGILVRRGDQLRYWHLTFQEYLAACALDGRRDADRLALLLTTDPSGPDQGDPQPLVYRPEWRETVLLLAGVLCKHGTDRVDGLVTSILTALGERATRAQQARAAGLLGAIVRDLAPFGYQPADPRYGECLHAAQAVFDPAQAPAIPLPDRIAAAEALARAGDPRLDWTHPGRWIVIAGGQFLMGAQRQDWQAPGYEPQAADSEAPVHPVAVSGFRIAAFPVTVAEYGAFLDDEGYRDPGWWQAGCFAQPPAPNNWENQQAHPSRPVVGVSWIEATAFCAWLSARLRQLSDPGGTPWLPEGLVVRLPTEAEWEYAARGPTSRRYPWGHESPDGNRANYAEARVGAPSPVGVFTGDRTPEGVYDLAGNVCEWCLDAKRKGFYAACLGQGVATDPLAAGDASALRVLRGGAFFSGVGGLLASCRGRAGPEDQIAYFGFRCVLAAPRQP